MTGQIAQHRIHCIQGAAHTRENHTIHFLFMKQIRDLPHSLRPLGAVVGRSLLQIIALSDDFLQETIHALLSFD